jgi:uncharacterized membrane protein (TIGR02234 family)
MSEQPDRSASTPPDAPERTAPEPTAAGPAPEPTATPPAEPPRPARLSRRTTVLAGLVAAGALAGTTRTTWVQASAPDLAGTAQEVAVTGADAAPAVLALALAALAAALATSLSIRWVRFLTGPVLIAAGLGAGLAALGPLREPVEAAGSAVAESTGVVGASIEASATSWPLLALVPALGVIATGVVVLLVGRTWPVGSRYRSAAVAASADPAEDPAAAWDALTRGEDPSLEDQDDPSLDDDEHPAQDEPSAAPGDDAPGRG